MKIHKIHTSPACVILKSKHHIIKALQSLPTDASCFVLTNDCITFESDLVEPSASGFTFESEVVYALKPARFK
jgi:hypothetical protein